jgi:hypothetical protein
MDLGNDKFVSLFSDTTLASEIKEILIHMGDQINDVYWDKDKRRQIYSVHSDVRSIIYKWTEATEDTIGETFTTDYTPSVLTSKVYEVVDKAIKSFKNPNGINHGPRTRVVRLMLAKLKVGGTITPHEDHGNLLLTHRVHFVVQTNDQCKFTIDDQDFFFNEGLCFELNNAKTHSVTNSGDTERIHLICDLIVQSDSSDIVDSTPI